MDGRDLGAFVVALLEADARGAFNADGHPLELGAFLETCIRMTGVSTEVIWVPESWVLERRLEELFPMWEPGASGRVVMDASKARRAGPSDRPVEETITATPGWDRARGLPEPMLAGLTPEREAGLLAELDW